MRLTWGAEAVEVWLVLALAHGKRGDIGKSRQNYEKAIAWLKQHPIQDPFLRRLRGEAEKLLGSAKGPNG